MYSGTVNQGVLSDMGIERFPIIGALPIPKRGACFFCGKEIKRRDYLCTVGDKKFCAPSHRDAYFCREKGKCLYDDECPCGLRKKPGESSEDDD